MKFTKVQKFKDFTLYKLDWKPIYYMSFKDDIKMALTFLRFQEFYESPKFRNKVFGLAEFIEWYCKDREDKDFSYINDWAGYNIPSHIIDKFEKTFSGISSFEKNIIDSKRSIIKENGDINYYLIGSLGKDKKTMKHEICHGLYFTDIEYKRSVNKLIKSMSNDVKSKINEWLEDLGYHKSVFIDETQAYLSTDGSLKSIIGEEEHKKLTKIFSENLNKFLK